MLPFHVFAHQIKDIGIGRMFRDSWAVIAPMPDVQLVCFLQSGEVKQNNIYTSA